VPLAGLYAAALAPALPWLAIEFLAAGLLLGVTAVVLIIVPVRLARPPGPRRRRPEWLMTCAGRQSQPVAYMAEQEESQQAAGHQAARDEPLPRTSPGDLAPGPAQPVTRSQPEHLAEVAEHVDGHGAEP
jgi:hypothetical protein